MLESQIQGKIINWLKKEGYFVIKHEACNVIGLPDIQVISPICNESFWLEVKQENGRLSPAQEMVHEKLRLFNQRVYTVKSLNAVKQIVEGSM